MQAGGFDIVNPMAVSVFLWALCLGVLARCVAALRAGHPGRDSLIAAALVAAAVMLLFRPHEDIYGGQDPGAYVNSSMSIANRGSLFHRDEMLALLPEGKAHLFFHGHSGFRQTRDACVWVRDSELSIVGPWFQPAYSILASIPGLIAGVGGVLLVSPLFGLFTAAALAALAFALTRNRWAALLAFVFYALDPNTLWQARCPRPELPAGFLLAGAWALLLSSARKPDMRAVPDTVLGVLALFAAPFFHVTLWPASILTAVAFFCAAPFGRPHMAVIAPFGLLALAILDFQSECVTNCYGFLKYTAAIRPWTPLLAAVTAAGSVGAALIGMKRPLSVSRLKMPAPAAVALAAAGLACVAVILLLACGVRFSSALAVMAPRSSLTLTDMAGWVSIESSFRVAILIAGMAAIALGRGIRPAAAGAALLICWLPAIVLVGRVPQLMYFARRYQPALIPLSALAASFLVLRVSRLPRFGRIAAASLASLAIIAGIAGRSRLFTLTENKGLTAFLTPFAETVKRENGILLCEYTRLAAPFDHVFGISTLGIDQAMRTDDEYTDIVRIWDDIRSWNPGRPAFFATPFADTRFPTNGLTVVKNGIFDKVVLERSHLLPRRVRRLDLQLTLYRFPPPDRPPDTATQP